MKNYIDRHEDNTEAIRSVLCFLQFIENKIIKHRVHKISTQEVEEIDGFHRFMSKHLK